MKSFGLQKFFRENFLTPGIIVTIFNIRNFFLIFDSRNFFCYNFGLPRFFFARILGFGIFFPREMSPDLFHFFSELPLTQIAHSIFFPREISAEKYFTRIFSQNCFSSKFFLFSFSGPQFISQKFLRPFHTCTSQEKIFKRHLWAWFKYFPKLVRNSPTILPLRGAITHLLPLQVASSISSHCFIYYAFISFAYASFKAFIVIDGCDIFFLHIGICFSLQTENSTCVHSRSLHASFSDSTAGHNWNSGK